MKGGRYGGGEVRVARMIIWLVEEFDCGGVNRSIERSGGRNNIR